MLVVTEVKVQEVEGDAAYVVRLGEAAFTSEIEKVEGRQFIHPSTGQTVLIGTTVAAGGVIGIMYDAWDSLGSQLIFQTAQLNQTLRRLHTIESMNFFERLAFLFTGRID